MHCAAVLNRLNSFLDHVDVGEYIVEGDLEAYSCESHAVTAAAGAQAPLRLACME